VIAPSKRSVSVRRQAAARHRPSIRRDAARCRQRLAVAVPTVPAANVAVVIESAGFTVIVNCFVAVCAVGVSASVTVTVNVVPTPVANLRSCSHLASVRRQAASRHLPRVGRHSARRLQRRRVVRSVDSRRQRTRHHTQRRRRNRDAQSRRRALRRRCLRIGYLYRKVNRAGHTAVGVPVIAPVPPFNVKPAGSAPTLIDQAYGVMPPVAPSVWLYAVPSVPPGSVAGVIFSVGALIAMPGWRHSWRSLASGSLSP